MKRDFFVIDSLKLNDICSKLYGYLINDYGVFCGDNFKILFNDLTCAQGAWVYVDSNNKYINIFQDRAGCFGLYLYQGEDRFCLSNSFLLLCEYLFKNKCTWSINKKFCNAFLATDFCPLSYEQTAVNEIVLLPRFVSVSIEKASRKVNIKNNLCCENNSDISSIDGLKILDNWHDKWLGIINNISKIGANLSFDLSGGFDSRVVLSLLLDSDAKSNAYIYSYDPGVSNRHTYNEDYQIAHEIADSFGFKLNDRSGHIKKTIRISLPDVINNSFYVKFMSHKWMSYSDYVEINPVYYFPGYGAENIRKYWYESVSTFMNKQKCQYYYDDKRDIILSSMNKIVNDYDLDGDDERFIPQLLYRETRSRNHFGKLCILNYLKGMYTLSPTMDVNLNKIDIRNKNADNVNLLLAVIFKRYKERLMKFKFDSNRSISKEAVELAENINQNNPYRVSGSTKNVFLLTNCGYTSLSNTVDNRNYADILRSILKSDWCKDTFVSNYNEYFYNKAINEKQGYNSVWGNAVISLAYLHSLHDESVIESNVFDNIVKFAKIN